MKYYSEKLNKLFDSEKSLRAEEDKAKELELTKLKKEQELKEKQEKLKKTRAEDSKKIDEALKEAQSAVSNVEKLISEFVAKYGSYHTSIVEDSLNTSTLNSLLSDLFSVGFLL